MGYKSNFFNRVTNEYNPKAEVEVETYISTIIPETDKEGEETGRLRIKGWTNTYNGVEPVEFVVPQDLASAVENLLESGMTVKIYADIINEKTEVIKETTLAIGKPKVDKVALYKNEWILTGASEPYEEGVTEFAPYKTESINLAIQERESKIKSAENKKLNAANPFQKNDTPSGAEKGRSISW